MYGTFVNYISIKRTSASEIGIFCYKMLLIIINVVYVLGFMLINYHLLMYTCGYIR